MTRDTRNFLLEIVHDLMQDAEVYTTEDADANGYYKDRLAQLERAREELLVL
jgi:hypothetical protein